LGWRYSGKGQWVSLQGDTAATSIAAE